MQLLGQRAPGAGGNSLLLDKLESGIVALETDCGPIYVQPSGWERLYLLWTFRHFNSLPLKTLNSRQRRLVERLPRCSARGMWDGVDRIKVIGTVEGATVPAIAPPSIEAQAEVENAESAFIPAALLDPVAPHSYEKTEHVNETSATEPSLLPHRRGHSRIALILAAGTLFAVVAKTAWHRFQPTPHAATVTTAVQVAGNQAKDVAIAVDTNAAPVNASLPVSIQSNLDAVGSSTGMAAPPSPAPMVSDPSPSVVTPAAIISPLEPAAIQPAIIKHTPTAVSANKSGSKENSGLVDLQGDKTEEEMPRIQFSGPPRKLIYPDYPDTRFRGKVSLEAVIGADGRVQAVKILSGNKVLSAAAARAIRQWRYDPFYKDGQRVETETTVAMVFVAADVISISFPKPSTLISQ